MIAGLVEILVFQASGKSSRDSWWPSFRVPWSGWSWRLKGVARPARSAVRSVARGEAQRRARSESPGCWARTRAVSLDCLGVGGTGAQAAGPNAFILALAVQW